MGRVVVGPGRIAEGERAALGVVADVQPAAAEEYVQVRPEPGAVGFPPQELVGAGAAAARLVPDGLAPLAIRVGHEEATPGIEGRVAEQGRHIVADDSALQVCLL